MGYPRILIYPKRIQNNALVLRNACLSAGVTPVAVIKGFNGHPAIVQALIDAGYTCMCSSRLPHLQTIKQKHPHLTTMMLRIPMLSELPKLLQVADISLNSEPAVLRALNDEAAKQGKIHQVILMRDLGDLREGQIDRGAFYSLADLAEQLPKLYLLGIGTNLTCYGSIIPSNENLSELVEDAKVIENRIGRKLDIISGGSTSSLPLVFNGKLPAGINQLRLGEALTVPCDLIEYWQCPLPGLSNTGLLLEAEVVEVGIKPTMPVGIRARNAFGTETCYVDRGWRKRAILAVGVSDIGDETKLIPVDPGIHILGASSDHLVIDIHDSDHLYQLGDIVTFQLQYKTMLFSMEAVGVEKEVCFS